MAFRAPVGCAHHVMNRDLTATEYSIGRTMRFVSVKTMKQQLDLNDMVRFLTVPAAAPVIRMKEMELV